MIRISLGNPGSGKTLCEIREMVTKRTGRKVYTNVVPKRPDLTPHIIPIRPEMIAKKEIIGTKNKRDGTIEEITKLSINKEFWMNINEPVSVVIDEAHTIMNARRAMSKTNIVITDWLALIRRVLGQSDGGEGELVLISQLWNRIDNIARDMATQVRYHICHYHKACLDCGVRWSETSETPEQLFHCPCCGKPQIKKYNHRIQVYHFRDVNSFQAWKLFGEKTFHRRYFVTNAEQYFQYYDTMQWDNMFSELY